MSFYNLIFGRNPNSDIVLALIGLKESDVERFRDCGIDFDDERVYVYTRTGGGNREDYPNELLTSNPNYVSDEDDDFDSTYATFYFTFPEEIAKDIPALANPREHGYPASLIQHIAATIEREPTENDKSRAAYEKGRDLVRELTASGDVTIWNGWVVVPISDCGMESLLEFIEDGGGDTPDSWVGGNLILPYRVRVRENSSTWSWDKNKPLIEQDLKRVVVDAPKDWEVDTWWWDRWQEKFGEKYPRAIQAIREGIK